MVSRCCSKDVRVEGHTTHYYVCNQCDMATDLKELTDEKKDFYKNNLSGNQNE